MADTTVHAVPTAVKPSLHDDLRRMSADVARMEEALRGVAGAMHAITSGGLLDHLPKGEEYRAHHEAATGMLRLIHNHVQDVLDAERFWDPSCELVFLADKAKDGRLIRYNKAVPE